jgi:hypothetical protein
MNPGSSAFGTGFANFGCKAGSLNPAAAVAAPAMRIHPAFVEM